MLPRDRETVLNLQRQLRRLRETPEFGVSQNILADLEAGGAEFSAEDREQYTNPNIAVPALEEYLILTIQALGGTVPEGGRKRRRTRTRTTGKRRLARKSSRRTNK